MTQTQFAQAALFNEARKLRLAYFVTHPIQYQVPLLRRISQEPDIDLHVYFGSDLSIRGQIDAGFGVMVKWDIPLLEGYKSEFLPKILDVKEGGGPGFYRPLSTGIGSRIRQGKFDAVWIHGYNYLPSLMAARAARASNIPVLLRAESNLHDRPRSKMKLAVKNLFFRLLKSQISATLPIGSDNADYWRHYFGQEFPQFPVVYTVNNEFFQRECAAAAANREQFRASLGLEPGRPVILFAAKLMDRKRCCDLVEACLQIFKEDRLRPRPYLLIVGDGTLRKDLEEQAGSFLGGDIRFLGFRNQSELPPFYDLCNLFVLASVDEPWGLSINEVMNAGRPVMVTPEVGCQRDLVRHGVNGYVVAPRNPSAQVEALVDLFSDPEKWKKMGAESLRIISGHGYEHNVAGLRQALRSLVPGFPIFPVA